MNEKIAILDAGSQFGKVIDRRVRELKCFCEILPLDTPVDKLKEYKGIIISGGPESVNDDGSPKCDKGIFSLNIPILGICYGMQLLNYFFGGGVEKKDIREDGQISINIDNSSKIFNGLEEKELVLLTHGDSISNVAPDFKVIGTSKDIVVAIEHKNELWYGLQFHPEVDLTVNGKQMLSNFLFDIAGMTGSYNLENRLEKAINEIKTVAGEGVKGVNGVKEVRGADVVVLVSGGVDSTVCCALLYKALGAKRVHGIHIDTGFMRKGESERVKIALENCGFNLQVVNAKEEFYGKLNKKTDPEEKRQIIGDTFMEIVDREIAKLNLSNYLLAQGTLRPDLIESANRSIASSKATTIKTHHNDTKLVREKRKLGLIIEPLKDYHKDEVRVLGRKLGLPEHMVDRHPFPGPGLAIRILCADEPYITKNFQTISGQLKNMYSEEKVRATLLPIRSVGVQGDGRSYSYVVVLAFNGGRLIKWERLFEMAKEIVWKYHNINRVIYSISDGDVENWHFTKTYLEDDTVSTIRSADDKVNQVLTKYGMMDKVSQVPVVLIPVSFGDGGDGGDDGRGGSGDGKRGVRSVVIRTFMTNDFMTGVPAIPDKDVPAPILEEMVEEILTDNNISRVFYDLTSKPPGTTEWE